MLGPNGREVSQDNKDTGIWFNVDTVDDIIENLESKNIKTDIEPETFYGRKVVSFKDINGFQVSFSCELIKK